MQYYTHDEIMQCYSQTDIGKFVETYKTLPQNSILFTLKKEIQAQKSEKQRREKITNKFKLKNITDDNKYSYFWAYCALLEKGSFTQTDFKLSHLYPEDQSVEGFRSSIKRIDEVFVELMNKTTDAIRMINTFYNERKNASKINDKKHRREHASSNVNCDFCNCVVTRTNLSRHKKNNKYCLEIQNKKDEPQPNDTSNKCNIL